VSVSLFSFLLRSGPPKTVPGSFLLFAIWMLHASLVAFSRNSRVLSVPPFFFFLVFFFLFFFFFVCGVFVFVFPSPVVLENKILTF